MAFSFRYERLLAYRRHLQETAEIELSSSRGSLNLAKEALASMTLDLEKTEASLQAGLARSLLAAEIKSHADYLEILKKRIALQVREIERLEALVLTRREALLERSKDVKVIEQLKERDFQRWKRHQEDSEQKRLNEVGILRHGRASA